MNIEVNYFGLLTDETGCKQEQLQVPFSTIQELNEFIQSRYNRFKELSYRIAVNSTFASEEEKYKDGDKISFLPPFAGG